MARRDTSWLARTALGLRKWGENVKNSHILADFRLSYRLCCALARLLPRGQIGDLLGISGTFCGAMACACWSFEKKFLNHESIGSFCHEDSLRRHHLLHGLMACFKHEAEKNFDDVFTDASCFPDIAAWQKELEEFGEALLLAENLSQRTLLLRQWEEVQEVLRGE